MREPNCPHCRTRITDHRPGRCLDAWLAELVMGFAWVKVGEGHTSPEAGRWLAAPDIFARNEGFITPPFVPAGPGDPAAVAPFVNVPRYSEEDANVIPVQRRMGSYGFNIATVYYAGEGRWKCSFVHSTIQAAVGGLTHESLPYAVTSGAVEAFDLFKRYRSEDLKG